VRIFQVISSAASVRVGTNRTWFRNLHEPLVDMGHEVVLFPAEEGRAAMERNDARARAAFSERLVERFIAEHSRRRFDLFFAYLMDGMVDPDAIVRIRSAGVPTCNFSCNNAHQFHLVDGLSPVFDLSLHSERDAAAKFRAVGARPLWWPMASNPKYFRPHDVPRTVDVSFVGANYALRARYILHLLEHGTDVHAYGPGWGSGRREAMRAGLKRWWLLGRRLASLQENSRYRASAALADDDRRAYMRRRFPANLHHPVPDDELILLYSRSRVSLGFLEVYDRHDASRPVTRHMHLREFEAPMCGALYMTGYTDEVAECFEPGKEVVVYRNEEELLDKVRYYLAHPAEGERVRSAGLARALAEHTYQHRFETLFREFGIGHAHPS
jgi:spore maturation protein CgeB